MRYNDLWGPAIGHAAGLSGGLAAMVGGVGMVLQWLVAGGDWLASPQASPAIHLLMVGALAAIVALRALQSQRYGLPGM
jgi:hypothetical protein